MSKNIFFGFSTFLGIIIALSYFGLNNHSTRISQNATLPSLEPIANFDPAVPPSQALKGQITNLNGEVKWQSRVATQAAEVKTLSSIQQGEELETGEDGKISLEFPQTATISLGTNSQVNFAQTLPIDLVFVQSKGSIDYQKLGQNKISIRIENLLVEPDSQINVTITKDQPIITVTAIKGSVTIAFNDSNQVTQTRTLKQGQILNFNDDKLQAKVS